jgi:hypothetical protein
MKRNLLVVTSILLLSTVLGGCAVVSVASTAVSTAATVGGLAVDAAVGTAKVTGKVVGKTVDVVTGGSD